MIFWTKSEPLSANLKTKAVMSTSHRKSTGVISILASALFLGLAPVFGKAAIQFGFSPIFVVAFRTSLAALLLFLIIAIFRRQYLYIFPAGLLGCLLAGAINGVGSILYYQSLSHLPASIGQLIYSIYPLFVALWLVLDNQPPSRLTLFRMGLALVAIVLLTIPDISKTDLIGVVLMLGGSALYALHIPINQRVLYEIPAPTVTLYTLFAMSIVVVPVYFLFDRSLPPVNAQYGPLIGLTLVTFFSRLTLFLGVKHIGGMQAALLGLAELFITILASHLFLDERLSAIQWVGAIILAISLLLFGFETYTPVRRSGGWLSWISAPKPKITIPFDQ
jgi:drug/metabolite transporter (DMT)-like permease